MCPRVVSQDSSFFLCASPLQVYHTSSYWVASLFASLLLFRLKKPFLAYGRGASAALSGHSVGPLKTPKQGASSKHSQHTFRHGGNCCEIDFGRHRISSKPVRNKWTSGLLLTRCTKRHDLETRKNQKDYYRKGINQVLLCDANDDYGKQLAKDFRSRLLMKHNYACLLYTSPSPRD